MRPPISPEISLNTVIWGRPVQFGPPDHYCRGSILEPQNPIIMENVVFEILRWLSAAWCAYLVVNALSSGSILLKGGSRAQRDQSPVTYWFFLVLYCVATVIIVLIPLR
jgi:hypothetical protein